MFFWFIYVHLDVFFDANRPYINVFYVFLYLQFRYNVADVVGQNSGNIKVPRIAGEHENSSFP